MSDSTSVPPAPAPRSMRTRLFSLFSCAAIVACFGLVGIGAVNAGLTAGGDGWKATPGASQHSPTNGSFLGNEAFTVINGTGLCNTKYTMAEAKHVPKGSTPGTVNPTVGGGTTTFSGGSVQWSTPQGIAQLNGGASSAETTGWSDDIGYTYETQMLDPNKDKWIFDTTGTCLLCPDEGEAEYYVRTRTELTGIASWQKAEEAGPPLLSDTLSIEYATTVTDHFGRTDELFKTVTPPSGTSAASISFLVDSTRDKVFTLTITQAAEHCEAHGTYKVEVTGQKNTLGGSLLKASAGEVSNEDKADTKVTHLWMTPKCNGVAAYPGSGNTTAWWTPTQGLSAADYAFYLVAKYFGDTGTQECSGETGGDPTSESNQSGSTPIGPAVTRDLPSEQIPSGFASGSASIVAFSDGSLIVTTTYRNAPNANPQICKVCKKVIDKNGVVISCCCKGKETFTYQVDTPDGHGGTILAGTVVETPFGDSECDAEGCD